ncbi:hypothetical protein [Serratia fonticola]|uniref:Uncharacterized protein n=1 Tax=Serratia fonticola TaxID=47917 RepID=A0AAW3WW74_SERFO|nr:hypothetical protein [Serratia fonticola]MBC3213852.1 hypothetical protein [Serratia fonticola]NYA13125.1 hypothetical protein [Serratia fonticola]NYA33452.1 hypothetical protein [Serratia fonticola]
MDIKNLSKAADLKASLEVLQVQHQMIVRGDALGVTISGSYQDAAFVKAIQPHVLSELSRRIEAEKHALAELGITF